MSKNRERNQKHQAKVKWLENRAEVWLTTHPMSRRMVSVPIRDTHRDGAPVVFFLDFYGMTYWQLGLIQMDGEVDETIGAWPIRSALRRRGYDPDRYQCFLWDLLGD